MAEDRNGERDRDPKSGRYQTEFSERAFLEALDANAPAGTREVAEAVGCHHKAAYDRLKQLEAEGKATSKQVGRLLIWEPSD